VSNINESLSTAEAAVFQGRESLWVRLWLPIALISFGVMGWLASLGLTVERIKVATNPDAALACDISPFLSCKSVMLSEQAALFGFPNPLIGLTAFAAPIFVAFALLAGAKFASWFWQLFMVGNLLGMIFVFWLFTQSAYEIGFLCIYCMVAWAAMIPIFWLSLGYTASRGHLGPRLVAPGGVVFEWAWVLILMTYLAITALVVIEFWQWWPSLFR
jgi:uncharacterized membrane protein